MCASCINLLISFSVEVEIFIKTFHKMECFSGNFHVMLSFVRRGKIDGIVSHCHFQQECIRTSAKYQVSAAGFNRCRSKTSRGISMSNLSSTRVVSVGRISSYK